MDDNKQAGEFFDRFAEIFDTFYEGKRSKWMQWVDRHFRPEIYRRFDLTFETFGDLNGKTVIDIGCGSGVYVMQALRRGAAWVQAVDPAPGMLKLLRTRLQNAGLEQRCELIQSAFPAPNLKPADHVIVMGVMDYVKDAEEFLRLAAFGDAVRGCGIPQQALVAHALEKISLQIAQMSSLFLRRTANQGPVQARDSDK